MCMKYVNASTRCYKSITSADNNIISYDIPFTSITHDNIDKEIAITKFTIVTNIDLLGTSNEKHKPENPLESKKTLDFIIRLTKCSNTDVERLGYDLDTFSIDLSQIYESGQVGKACFGFLNYTRTTSIDTLKLPGKTGKYVIKLLIKDSKDLDYTIQTMSQLTVV